MVNKKILIGLGLCFLFLIPLSLLDGIQTDSRCSSSQFGTISSTWFAQLDAILNGTQIGDFNESYLLLEDGVFHVITSSITNTTTANNTQKVAVQYEFNLSGFVGIPRRLDVDLVARSIGFNFSKIREFNITDLPLPSTYNGGLEINESGYVYVTHGGGSSAFNGIIVYAPDGRNVTRWGSWGTGDGEFRNPNDLAINSSGYVYVVDTSNNRVQIFNASGGFIGKWGSTGTGNGQFDVPIDVAVNETGHVYVLDRDNARIQVFTPNGTFLFKWGSGGSGDGQFNLPHSIVINKTGFVYVAEEGNYRIQIFMPNGTFVEKWTAFSLNERPWKLGLDFLGNVYVTTDGPSISKRFRVFSPSGVEQGNGIALIGNEPPRLFDCAVNGTGHLYFSVNDYSSSPYWIGVLVYDRDYELTTTLSVYNRTAANWSQIIRENVSSHFTITPSISGNISAFLDENYTVLLRLEVENASYFNAGYFTLLIDKFVPVLYSAPPYFDHNQSRDIYPNYIPLPQITFLNVSCLIYDEPTEVDVAWLQENSTGSLVNRTMQNETLTKYEYYLNITDLTNETLMYRFVANDTEGNINWTRWYFLERDYEPPQIVSYTEPLQVEYVDLVYVYANVTDANNLSTVALKWSSDNWVTNQSLAMNLQNGNTYRTTARLPNRVYDTIVKYEIYAEDDGGNERYHYSEYQVDDFSTPTISGIKYAPDKVTEVDRVLISCTIYEPSDASGIESVILYYVTSLDNFTSVTGIIMQENETDKYFAWIDELPLGTSVRFVIYARDIANNEVYSSTRTYEVVEVIAYFNTFAFIAWLAIIIFIIAAIFILYRTQNLKWWSGLGVLGGGVAVLTAFIFTGYVPFELHGLTVGEWVQEVGTRNWVLLAVGIAIAVVVGFFALRAILKGKEIETGVSGFRIPF